MLAINNTTKQKIDKKSIKKLVFDFLSLYKKEKAEVSLAIIADQKMRQLNRDYRGIDKVTDVLSFPSTDKYFNELKLKNAKKNNSQKEEREDLGEIIINIQETKRFSKYKEMFAEIDMLGDKRSVSSNYILSFLIIHGLLHLLGYEDQTKKGHQEMLLIAKRFLE